MLPLPKSIVYYVICYYGYYSNNFNTSHKVVQFCNHIRLVTIETVAHVYCTTHDKVTFVVSTDRVVVVLRIYLVIDLTLYAKLVIG